MKLRKVFLGASLVANVALLAIALGTHHPRTATADAPAGPAVGSPATATPAGDASRHAGESVTAGRSTLSWAALDTSDLRKLMSQLLAAGFPRHVATAIINERLNVRREALYLELWGDETRLPFWQYRDQHYDPATRARLFRAR